MKDLNELRLSLIEAGYEIRFEKPPMQGTYGLINIKKKVIWIAPITQQMGIFRATFLHEAIHAAQTVGQDRCSQLDGCRMLMKW